MTDIEICTLFIINGKINCRCLIYNTPHNTLLLLLRNVDYVYGLFLDFLTPRITYWRTKRVVAHNDFE